MRMVNRLIEPTSGHTYLDDEDVLALDPVQLRRRIGYVIQQIGLFPHLTIADNVATVPRLLGWKRDRVRARVDELLDLVGLPPAAYRDRYPSQLRSEEHTSELQSLMRSSYAVFCLNIKHYTTEQ